MQYYNMKNRSAFTLLEILVAMSIIILILGAVYGSYRAMATSISHCRPRNILEQQANLFLLRLNSELRCCYACQQNQGLDITYVDASENELPEEVAQQETHTLFIGEGLSAGKIFLQFITTFTLSTRQNSCGLSVVSYKLDNSGKVLLRNVRKYTEKPDNDDGKLKWFEVLSNIKDISCKYYEDKKWRNEWKSKDMNILPQAIRISFILEGDQTGPVSFESCAYIKCEGYKTGEADIQNITARYNL